MSGFLLDTNSPSKLVKPKPEAKVMIWIDSVDENLLYLSVLTLSEIRKGIASLCDASRRVTLEAWLDSDLILRFAERILPIDHAVADRWGRIAAAAAAAKSPLPVIDGLLAAAALDQNFTLVTRNTKDIAVTGLQSLERLNSRRTDGGSEVSWDSTAGNWGAAGATCVDVAPGVDAGMNGRSYLADGRCPSFGREQTGWPQARGRQPGRATPCPQPHPRTSVRRPVP